MSEEQRLHCKTCGQPITDADGYHYEYPDHTLACYRHAREAGTVMVITKAELLSVSLMPDGTFFPEYRITRHDHAEVAKR